MMLSVFVDLSLLQYLKQVARNTRADSYTTMKKWLAIIPDGKLPTNQKIEGK
jgi:hypothetical protein